MERTRGVAVLLMGIFVAYGCGGDDDSGGAASSGGTAGRAGGAGHGGSAGAKGGNGAVAGTSNTAGSHATGGRGGTSPGGTGGVGGSATAGVGGTTAGVAGTSRGGRGGTTSVGGGAGEAGGGQAGAAGGASPGTGGTNGSAGETAAGSGGEGGQPCTPGSELVENGDFEGGNFAFSTQYELVTAPDQINDTDQCIIASDASVVREGATDWAQFGDHTSGSGKMLICDGSVTADTYVWQQTLTVEPHQWYEVHFWFASVETNATFLPSLQAFADGVAVDDALQADSSGAWTDYTGFYQAGDNTTVALSIVDASTDFAQNDFALDDVSFARTCEH